MKIDYVDVEPTRCLASDIIAIYQEGNEGTVKHYAVRVFFVSLTGTLEENIS